MKKLLSIISAISFLLTQGPIFAQEEKVSIKDYLEKALPPQEGRNIVYNDNAKLLTVTDTKSNQKLIKRLIAEFEVGQKQVMIETRFVEVDITALRELGIEWQFYQRQGQNVNQQPWKEPHSTVKSLLKHPQVNQPDSSGRYNPTYQGIHWDDSIDAAFPKTGVLAGQLWLSKLTAAGDFLTANLRMMEQEGKANLLSAPKVTTISGQMANLQSVRIQPYISDFTLENIGTAEFPLWDYKLTISEKPIGIILEVTPYVNEGSNTITLDVHPEVSVLHNQVRISSLDENGTTQGDPIIADEMGWPVVETRTTQASVVIDSGETIVFGGLIKDEESTTKRKVPLLGDIPLLGKLFQYDYKNQRKKELLIFITANIITADGEAVAR